MSRSLSTAIHYQLRQQSRLKSIAHSSCLQPAFWVGRYPTVSVIHLSIDWLIVKIAFDVFEKNIYLFEIELKNLNVFELGVSLSEFVGLSFRIRNSGFEIEHYLLEFAPKTAL